ncbi:SDR family NAD(P)-dependent oxidoreductase [Chloroflexota bacterium]
MKLEKLTAIITGAGRGIGRVIALTFASEEAGVVLCDVNMDDCQMVETEIKSNGGSSLTVKCDISSRTDVEDLMKTAMDTFGRVDILVNNAAVTTLKPFLAITDEEWEEVIKVNLTGQFICSQVLARHMVKRGQGRIINIASICCGGAGNTFPLLSHYAASKGGVVALTEAIAQELAPYGITVNAICPGSIEGQGLDSIKKRALSRIPLGRLGKPEEVARLAVFLASEDSGYITGAHIPVDGGWLTT